VGFHINDRVDADFLDSEHGPQRTSRETEGTQDTVQNDFLSLHRAGRTSLERLGLRDQNTL